ncbi:hypothetical protein KKP04_10130 [Rhodomicrobium sp. Az07]|uniref:hypothetical protein n=1 Tax=Rhodomicrobium sp. Az07 TaxID=2839034 RepID=UPI001BEAD435|nr:hypothetical protein [Rhodomicrobium sp. Az07]MBT3071228.1 hypothetical protein [Rhodomicrobium sp. Az07]
MRVLVACVVLMLGAAGAQAQGRNPYYGEPTDYLGTWNNVALQRNMVVRIEIRPEHKRGGVCVTVFGLRNGEPVVFGEYRGRTFLSSYPREREQDNSAVLVHVKQPYARGHVLLRFNGRGEIVAHSLLNISGRGDVYSLERFAANDRGGRDYDPRGRYPSERPYGY